MGKPRDNRQKDLLQPVLDEIIDLGHPLVRLAWETARIVPWGIIPGYGRRGDRMSKSNRAVWAL